MPYHIYTAVYGMLYVCHVLYGITRGGVLGYQMSVQYISGRYLGTIIVSLAYLPTRSSALHMCCIMCTYCSLLATTHRMHIAVYK